MASRSALAALLVTGALTVTGCGFSGIYDLPLPGGADLGEHPYSLKVQFRDVLDLVPQSGVKVNEVAVGRVEEIALAEDGWTAEVTLLVNGDVRLPANALAKLRQSSLLGEKYIELSVPSDSASDRSLADLPEPERVIPVDRTNRNTEIEEVLGALSMLLNGGGVEQLQNIAQELNDALEGNEVNIRTTLDNLDTFVSTLDAGKSEITRAIDGLNRLAGILNAQRDDLADAVENLGPGLKVLSDQRQQLVTMLQALDSLSTVAIDTVDRSKADIVADLKALLPTLQKLGEAGNDLPNALEMLVTFPFPDAAVGGVKGDYFNLFAQIDLDLREILDNISRSRNNPLRDVPVVGDLTEGQPGLPQLPQLPLPGNLGLPSGAPGSSGGSGGVGGIFDVLIGGGA